MKDQIRALRYLISALAVSAAFSLVCFAQQAAGQQQGGNRQNQPAQPVKEYPASRMDGIVAEWTRARDYTKEYLDAMPADGYSFKPTPDIRSFAEQMLHMTGGLFSAGARISGAANPYQGKRLDTLEELKTKAATTKVVMEGYDFLINALKGAKEAKLAERMPVGGMNRPLSVLLDAMFEHQTHHRGQTTIYLRLKGVTPPSEKLFIQ
jgi:uncharacterized damage-inducible protein DinB